MAKWNFVAMGQAGLTDWTRTAAQPVARRCPPPLRPPQPVPGRLRAWLNAHRGGPGDTAMDPLPGFWLAGTNIYLPAGSPGA